MIFRSFLIRLRLVHLTLVFEVKHSIFESIVEYAAKTPTNENLRGAGAKKKRIGTQRHRSGFKISQPEISDLSLSQTDCFREFEPIDPWYFWRFMRWKLSCYW